MSLRVAGSATLLALAVAPLAAPGFAADQELVPRLSGPELVRALAAGGHVVLFRHDATVEDQVDATPVDLSDCATQRNLSAEGRQQAERIGRAFRAQGIEVDRVLVSPYCRCVEMGELAFGEVHISEVLAPEGRLAGSERGARIRELLDTPPAAGRNTVLISHTAALLYSFGLEANPEGIAHVFRPEETGRATYLGMVLPDAWSEAAAPVPDEPVAEP